MARIPPLGSCSIPSYLTPKVPHALQMPPAPAVSGMLAAPPSPELPVIPPAKREANGAWAPGRSANPGGRPKSVGEVRKLARQQTEVAIQTLVQACTDDDVPWAARVAAANSLLDRGYGRPQQNVEIGGPGSFEQMSDDQLREYVFARARNVIDGEIIEPQE